MYFSVSQLPSGSPYYSIAFYEAQRRFLCAFTFRGIIGALSSGEPARNMGEDELNNFAFVGIIRLVMQARNEKFVQRNPTLRTRA